MELKNARDAWKKAKPLTLTKTGISEALSKLPADPKSLDDIEKAIPLYKKVKEVVDVQAKNKHIIAATKAFECLKQIQKALEIQIGNLEKIIVGNKSALDKEKQAAAEKAAKDRKERDEAIARMAKVTADKAAADAAAAKAHAKHESDVKEAQAVAVKMESLLLKPFSREHANEIAMEAQALAMLIPQSATGDWLSIRKLLYQEIKVRMLFVRDNPNEARKNEQLTLAKRDAATTYALLRRCRNQPIN